MYVKHDAVAFVLYLAGSGVVYSSYLHRNDPGAIWGVVFIIGCAIFVAGYIAEFIGAVKTDAEVEAHNAAVWENFERDLRKHYSK